MFIAMNRFRVVKGEEAAFETLWRDRDSHLKDVPGFQSFSILRGDAADDHTVFISHSTWRSEDDFRAWTRSEAFRLAHQGAGGHQHLYLGPPQFEGFRTVADID